ncbi:hypothetical protein [Aquimarina macrocephali]|uniref:hypothetical protein n=1 Tax=Aquimarina macrocephali TaxID=666563 RepID=UPI003F67AE40
MKKMLLLAIIMLCYSCFTKKSDEGNLNQELTEKEIARKTFSDIESLLKIDNGKFWNKQLYGPIILVNPKTRVFFSNENNATKKFKQINSIFSDTLPKHINIANTAINWDNKRWSMVILPLPDDKTSRDNLVIHELFHRVQPEIGFDSLQEQSNGHLDTYTNRILLKLELEALKSALSSKNEIKQHLKNALTFRKIRQNDEQKKEAENSLEINEGLAEFTGIMLSGRDKNEMKIHLINSINQFYTNSTFVRSFAYQTVPVYGYLLSNQKNKWHKDISKNTKLTDYFIESFGIDINSNSSFELIAQENNYNYNEILKVESVREDKRLAKILQLKTKFLEQPTLKLNLEKMKISFDPRNITPLENFGTVYPTMRITDNWGILTVNNGALLASNWENVIVTQPVDIDSEIIIGDGWSLELNESWKIEKVKDKFELKKH